MDIRNKQGGKVFASGGFGCVFTPALKCIGKSKRDKGNISKLMTNKHAKEEYDELMRVNSKLNVITNYKNYFLIDDFTLCKPSKLTKSDLKNYRSCGSLQKEKITANNINSSLDKLLAINMPYGGNTVEQFIITNKNYEALIELNDKLIDLLKNGILEMNNKHIYHSDIKASNILILVDNDMKTRLIDWSLTVEYIPFKNNQFPKSWKNRPLQFNVPFSIILFTDLFVDSYSKFLVKKENKVLLSKPGSKREILSEFIKKYLYLWMKEKGDGHYKYINKIMYMLFKYEVVQSDKYAKNNMLKDTSNMKKFIEMNYTIPCIVNYLVEILIHFTKFKDDGSLNMRYYLDNIFIKIIDVWGFIASYLPLYELLFENYYNLTEKQKTLFVKLKYIFLKYLYEPQVELIKLENLENHLKELNILIKHTNTK
uniref:Protein kinase domain-containing protein n=1 Tax=viral metagenome TaxID=1070528 RepID=A0A6C0JHM1_9ZZZZ